MARSTPCLALSGGAPWAFRRPHRRDAAQEERFLFQACVSRPRERLYLCWRSSDENGAAAPRSPFVDEVLDLLAPDSEAAELAIKRVRGPERVAPRLRGVHRASAPAPRRLAAVAPPRGHARTACHPRVLAEIAARDAVSANSLEGWLDCPYRWFVDHELRPQRLEPQADPLWLGGVVHAALERLYRDPPGNDSIPRPGDVGRWKQRPRAARGGGRAARGCDRPIARSPASRSTRMQRRSKTVERRPRADMRPSGASFGIGDDADPLASPRRARVHGVVDRVDVTPDGASAPRPRLQDLEGDLRREATEEGMLQLQLYMRAISDHGARAARRPLLPARRLEEPASRAASWPKATPPRGSTSSAPTSSTPRSSRSRSRPASSRAVSAPPPMRRGEIGRDPIGGECPKYCTLPADLPARALDRRRRGAAAEGAGA